MTKLILTKLCKKKLLKNYHSLKKKRIINKKGLQIQLKKQQQ